MDYRLIARDGRTVWIHDEAVMVLAPDGTFSYSQGLMQDITAAKQAEGRDRVRRLPRPVDGPAERRDVRTRSRRWRWHARTAPGWPARSCSSTSTAFKLANDSLGAGGRRPTAGDDRRRGCGPSAETDTLARRGGDEFLILLADLEAGTIREMQTPLLFAESVARRIRGLSAPFDVDGTEVFVSAEHRDQRPSRRARGRAGALRAGRDGDARSKRSRSGRVRGLGGAAPWTRPPSSRS